MEGRTRASDQSAILSSLSAHALTNAMYCLACSRSAVFALARTVSRSVLNAGRVRCRDMLAVYFAIRLSMHVGLEPGGFGHVQSTSHGSGTTSVGGVVVGIGAHFSPPVGTQGWSAGSCGVGDSLVVVCFLS